MNRSGFEAIAGKDALLEYTSKVYPEKTYVERNGLVYKSLTGTSATFIPLEWELIADLREVRVPDITSRNALTGITPTTGTTGIRIPILDNTNVLVLDASGDPIVGVSEFARYNYNETLASWLLLQIGTGSTSATTIASYVDITNKPSIISGVTVNAGAAMTGGGTILGTSIAPYAAGGSVTISHADTSSQANVANSGYAYIQTLGFDTYGHVTGASSSTWVHPDTSSQANVANSGYTYIQSVSVDGAGHVTTLASSTWTHPDTSSQASSVNAGNTYIQSINLDGDGHVTGIGTGTVAVAGGGYSVKINGDSGGALTVASGGTITISGGSNISTVRTGSASNAGVRININPAGSNTQLQFNNSGFLGASANLTFNTGTNTLSTSNLTLGSAPAAGVLADDVILRNSGGGLRSIPQSSFITANNGLTKSGANIRLGGTLTGNTVITSAGVQNLRFSNYNWTFGSRAAGALGANSFTIGDNNRATNPYTLATGNFTTAAGSNSFTGGQGISGKEIIAGGGSSFNYSTNSVSQTAGHGVTNSFGVILGGTNHNNTGSASAVLGGQLNKLTTASSSAIVVGINNTMTAVGSGNNSAIVAGDGNTLANSERSLISNSTTSQITNAFNSTIIGSLSTSITASAIRVVALGLNGDALGTTYNNHTVVKNLAVLATPVAGAAGTDDVLVWNSTDKKVKKVTQASLDGGGGTPAGANTQIQYNNAGFFGASSLLTFNGSTLVTPSRIDMGSAAAFVNNTIVGNTNSVGSEFKIFPRLGKMTISGSSSTTDSVKIKGADGSTGAGGVKILGGNNQVNNGASINIGGGVGGNGGGNVVITGGSGGAGVGGDLTLAGGDSVSFSTNRAGNINLTGGVNTGSGSGKGGNITITGGVGKSATTVDGGAVFILGANSTNTSTVGGHIVVKGGNSSTTATSGAINLTGGLNTSTGVGGNITLDGGSSTSGGGGGITIVAGASGAANGGNLVLRGGTGLNGGNLWIEGGLKGAGNSGDVFINDIFNNQANLYVNYGTSFLLSPTTGGKNVMVIGGASTNPTAAPTAGCIVYFDNSTFNLKAWKAGAGAPVILV